MKVSVNMSEHTKTPCRVARVLNSQDYYGLLKT